jgi:hypothetical protein
MTIANSIIIADNAFGTLGIAHSTSDTTLTFTTGHGARFPTVASGQVLSCCILNSNNVLEEVQVTLHTAGADTATMVRAANGSTAKAWSAGDRIEARLSSDVLKRLQQEALKEITITTADAGATYTGSISPTCYGLVTGLVYLLTLTTSNSGTTPTVNLSSLGAVTVVLDGSVAVSAGQMPLSGLYKYDGTNFVLLNPLSTSAPLTAVAGTNTITGTATIPRSAYGVGQTFRFIPANSNTGATTLNVNSLGAKNVFWLGAACVGGEIRQSIPVIVQYDGTQFNIVGNGFNAPFLDTHPIAEGSADSTKKVRFEVDGLTTGTTRVLTAPDADIKLAGHATGLTANRIPYASGATGGLLTDNANLTFDGTTLGVAGGQVAFPATQNPSADANTLDDYEEGTWTVVIRGDSVAGTQTYSTQTARYTKVGRIVHLEFRAVMTAKDAATAGSINIGTLPFTPGLGIGAMTLGRYSNIDLAVATQQLAMSVSGGVIYLQQSGDNTAFAFIAAASISATTEIEGSGSYSV